MEIPPKVRIPLCIEQGSVFNFHIDFESSERESKNRYFVVLNRNPKTDTALIMVTSTTQVAKRKQFVRKTGISERTLVLIAPKEYPVFTTESVIDCNSVFEVPMRDLIRKIEGNGSLNYPKIPDGILAKLILGINASPRIAPAVKKLL